MSPRSPIRTIFFDAAGTLVHLPKGAAWHYHHVAAQCGRTIPEVELSSAFRAVWKELPPPPETRIRRPDDDKGWWHELVHRVLDRCDVPADPWREVFFERIYAHFEVPGVWEAYPEVVRVLGELAPRFRLGIISNFDGRLRTILQELDLARYFDVVIISSEVGADKPSPWIFEEALSRAGVQAGESLHVGDDRECDWEAAATAGIAAFHLDRPNNSLLDLLEVPVIVPEDGSSGG